jgi:hypothetical protein
MWDAYGRGALEIGTQPEGQRRATITTGTLTFYPIDTFTASMLYSGQNESVAGDESARRGFTMQTNSRIYRGLDVQFGVGWTFLSRDTGTGLRDRFLSASASVIPRRDLTLTIGYSASVATQTGAVDGSQEFRSSRMFATVAWDPFSTLHVAVSQEAVASEDTNTRVFTNVGVNWAPLPDGALQFFLAYNESLRPLEYGTERNLRPGVRWWITRRSYLDVTYEHARFEAPLQVTETGTVSASLRLSF